MYKIWVDEAGRGPWLGPVCAVALCFNPKNKPSKAFITQLNDSKKLSEKKRDALYKELIKMSALRKPQIFFWLGLVDNVVIDEINIRQANREAMRRALQEILRKIRVSKKNIIVQIDWRDNYEFSELEEQPEYIVWWDWKVPEIWAASIIAKVFRDKILYQYATLYPELWLENHKWYWTKKHSENLQKRSDITWIHRLSYKPVAKVLKVNK